MKTKKTKAWFVEKLRGLDACSSAIQYAQTHRTFPEAWGQCARPDWLVWLLRSVKLIPNHQALITKCPGCKWDRENSGLTADKIRRRFSTERVAKALREAGRVLNIKLTRDSGRLEGRRYDRYYAREGDWLFEVFVPHGDDPTTVDVHFEFEDGEESE